MLSELWLIVFLLLPTLIYTQYIILKPAYVINNQIIFLYLLLRNDFAIDTDIF
jgi:cellulose synthase/poly-beta-1,6-N-acetylglucosamine synthase-like glycosyltransferase